MAIPGSSEPDWWEDDGRFRRIVKRRVSADAFETAYPLLSRMGRLAPGSFAPRARLADRHRPALVAYDREGNRVDRVEYHPSYLEMRRQVYGLGIVRPTGPDGPFPSVVKFALGYLFCQAEVGLYCPVACTDGVARVLERFAHPSLSGRFLPHLFATDPGELLEGAMFMTEREGGSDLSRIRMEARSEEGRWRIYGRKWFCSNVDAGLVLTLARSEAGEGTAGLTMFLVPRDTGGGRNRYRIDRLKDKLGVASMATGEVTFEGAEGHLVGEPGRGIHYAAELFNLSRLHNAVASVGIARRALREAVEATSSRVAFGRRVIDHPLARQDLAGLSVELEAHTALVFEAARLLDLADGGDRAAARVLRLLVPVSKVVTARFAVRAASEAIELRGGNGYIEDFDTPRLLRDAQVLPIWEGTSNVLALDALRATRKEAALDALLEDARDRVAAAQASVPEEAKQVEAALDRLEDRSPSGEGFPEEGARALVARVAAAYEGALLAEAAATGDEADRTVLRLFVQGPLARALEERPLELPEGPAALMGLSLGGPAGLTGRGQVG